MREDIQIAMFTRGFLVEMRRKAIHRRVWFKVLDRVERGILSLAVRVVEQVESAVLGTVLLQIVRKLRDSLKSEFVKRMEGFGLVKARKIAQQAISWGYEAARAWIIDPGFVRYLTMIEVNKPSGFGV